MSGPEDAEADFELAVALTIRTGYRTACNEMRIMKG